MRRRTTALLVMGMLMAAMMMASGVALAVNKVGTNGPDTLRGTDRDDNLLGKGGNDRVLGRGGNDNLLGGPGKDIVFGGDERGPGGGDKNLVGGLGNDVVGGGLGSDNMVGAKGYDLLTGSPTWREAFEDRLSAGAGNDVIDVVNRPAAKDVVVCGDGFDRVIADTKDVVASDCERVFIGAASFGEFIESIPQSFFEGLPPPFNQL